MFAKLLIAFLVFSSTLQATVSDSIKNLQKAGFEIMSTKYDFDGKLVDCFTCHYQTEPDTFCWKPSLCEIGMACNLYSEDKLKEQLLDPFSDRLIEDHAFIQLSDSQITAIYAFLTALQPQIQHTSPITKRMCVTWTLWATGLIVVVIGIKKLRLPFAQNIRRLFVFGSILVAVIYPYNQFISFGLNKNYAPLQIVKFSHKIHASDNKIACFYCHSAAYHGSTGGIPSTETCLNCHGVITEGHNTGEFYISKIANTRQSKQALPWTKVNALPDYVHFNHKLHVVGANIDCKTCHGNVAAMHRVKQLEPIGMTTCLKCHQNTYKYAMNNANDSVLVSKAGGHDCMNCHY